MSRLLPVLFQCDDCDTLHNLLTLLETETKLEPCCRETLMRASIAFGKAALKQTGMFYDGVASAAVLSSDPKLRAAGVRWRNIKNRNKG